MHGTGRPSITEIEPGLFLGDCESSNDLDTLTEKGISCIVSVLDYEHAFSAEPSAAIAALVSSDHRLFIEVLDTDTQDILLHLGEICDFIDRQMGILPGSGFDTKSDAHERVLGSVLVHCIQGVSRSATVVVAYLMRKYHKDLDSILSRVQRKRKIKPNSNFMAQLKIWEEVEYDIWEDSICKIPKPEYLIFLASRAAKLKAHPPGRGRRRSS